MEIAEKVYSSRESADEKQIKIGKVLNRDLAKFLLANRLMIKETPAPMDC